MYLNFNDELGALGVVIDVTKAVKSNRIYMFRIGWQEYFDEIVRLLGFTTFSPNEEVFAQAVAEWQEKQKKYKLDPDGIVGPKTWAKMKIALGLKSPSKTSKPSKIPSSSLPKAYKITYKTISEREYGGRFKATKPPGLPEYARKTSGKGEALEHVKRIAKEQGLGSIFVKAVSWMAKFESGGTFALPAYNFNVLPKSKRKGKALSTAWGVFSFNRDAWRSLPGVSKSEFPWDSTAYEEVARPIKGWYGRRFRQVLKAGGSHIDAAGGLRIFHIVPAIYKKWLKYAIAHGSFKKAWSNLNDIQIEYWRNRIRKTSKKARKQKLEKSLLKARKKPLRPRIEKFLKAAKILSSTGSLV